MMSEYKLKQGKRERPGVLNGRPTKMILKSYFPKIKVEKAHYDTALTFFYLLPENLCSTKSKNVAAAFTTLYSTRTSYDQQAYALRKLR